MYHWLLMICGILAIGSSIFLWDRARKRRIERTSFSGRSPLNSVQFAELFFVEPHQRRIAEALHRMLIRATIIDVSMIHPDDNFGVLQLFTFDSLAAEDFTMEIERSFNVNLPDDEVESLNTIRKLVMHIESIAGNS